MARQFDPTVSSSIGYPHVSAFDARETLAVWAWVYVESGANDWATILGQFASSQGFAWQIESGAEDAIFLPYRNGGGNALQGGLGSMALGWNGVYVTFDGGRAEVDRVKLWVGGVFNTAIASGNPTTIGTNAAQLKYGVRDEEGLYWKGRLAEPAFWLDADESRLASLAAGYTPDWFQTNLHVHTPLRVGDGAIDLKGNAGTPTISNASEVAHPPGLIYPPTTIPHFRRRAF